MLEKTRRIDINKTRKNEVISMGVDNFEEFYKGELEKDFKRPPREIKPEEYQPKRGVDNAVAGEGFKTHADRKADYFREYELFKENKSKALWTSNAL